VSAHRFVLAAESAGVFCMPFTKTTGVSFFSL
jgi:hypothetical protein